MDNRGNDAQQYQAPGDRQPQQHPLVKKKLRFHLGNLSNLSYQGKLSIQSRRAASDKGM